MKKLSVAVVGCGTAGLATGIYLGRAGHAVHLFERSAKLTPLGAGLLLQPTGLEVLNELGLLEGALACGQRVDQLYGTNASGRRVMDMRYRELAHECFGLGIQRGALFQLLLQALPKSLELSLSETLTELNCDLGTIANTAGRTFGPFDLVVVADGAHSLLRRAFSAHCHRDVAYPWGAVWCLVRDKQGAFAGTLTQRYRAATQMCGLLPVGHLPGEDRSEDQLCVYWSLPVADFTKWEIEGLGPWRTQVRDLWPAAADLLAQIQHPQQVAKASYRDVVHRRYGQGRAVLIGDAAHAMSPQLGQGANMALLDARALSQMLSSHADLSVALDEYDRLRREHLQIYQLASRWLTPLFQSNSALGAMLRDWCLHPVGRVPGIKAQTLKVLAGVQKGWFGRL